jgi:hypothetical protein
MKVRLKTSELDMSIRMARTASHMSRDIGIPNMRVDTNRSDLDVELLGVHSEIVVRKALGMSHGFSEMGPDLGTDIYVDCGKRELRVQVKGTFSPKGNLLFAKHSKFDWQVAVLVCKTEEDELFDIPGCIGVTQAQEVMVEKDLGHGSGWFVGREHLRPLGALMEWIQQERVS